MYSGLGTKILTRDLMRSHKFLLGDSEMKNIFQKWLQKHRLVLKIRPGNYVNIKVSVQGRGSQPFLTHCTLYYFLKIRKHPMAYALYSSP